MIRWRVGRYRQRSVSVQEHNASERELYEGPPPYGDGSHAAVVFTWTLDIGRWTLDILPGAAIDFPSASGPLSEIVRLVSRRVLPLAVRC